MSDEQKNTGHDGPQRPQQHRLSVNSPLLDVVERLEISDIVDNDDSVCAAVVRRSDGAETLLTGGILNNKKTKEMHKPANCQRSNAINMSSAHSRCAGIVVCVRTQICSLMV